MVWCQRDVILFPKAVLAEAPLHFSQLYLAQGIHDSLKYFFPWKTSVLPAFWKNKNARLDTT